jgi:hypothetical protein
MPERNPAKERSSFHPGSTWAYRAPRRAVKVAATARKAAARTSTCPFVLLVVERNVR